MKKPIITFMFIITCSLYSSNTLSAIFKCVSAQGSVFYNDKPCQSNNKETQVKQRFSSAISMAPYAGRLRHNGLVQKNVDLIEKRSRAALKTTMSHLGLQRSIGIIDIRVEDRLEKRQNGVLALASTVELYSVKRGIILFDPRYLSFNGYDTEKTLIHEITHAVLTDVLKDRHAKLPRWFKEGIAVWVSGQIEDKQKLTVFSKVFSKTDPLTLINGLEGEHTFYDYYEDGLFFEYLEKEYGQESIHKLIELLMAGNNYKTAFKLAYGSNFQTLQKEALQYSRKKLIRYLAQSDHKHYQSVKNKKASWKKQSPTMKTLSRNTQGQISYRAQPTN